MNLPMNVGELIDALQKLDPSLLVLGFTSSTSSQRALTRVSRVCLTGADDACLPPGWRYIFFQYEGDYKTPAYDLLDQVCEHCGWKATTEQQISCRKCSWRPMMKVVNIIPGKPTIPLAKKIAQLGGPHFDNDTPTEILTDWLQEHHPEEL